MCSGCFCCKLKTLPRKPLNSKDMCCILSLGGLHAQNLRALLPALSFSCLRPPEWRCESQALHSHTLLCRRRTGRILLCVSRICFFQGKCFPFVPPWPWSLRKGLGLPWVAEAHAAQWKYSVSHASNFRAFCSHFK